MNALYAVFLGACWFISSARGEDITTYSSSPADDVSVATGLSTDGSNADSLAFSGQTIPETVSQTTILSTASQPIITNTPSETTTPSTTSTTEANEPVTTNNPSGLDTATIKTPPATSGSSQESNIYTIPKKTTSAPTTMAKEPVTPKNTSATTSTPMLMSTAKPSDEKSSASLTKRSIFFIVIPALYYLIL